MVIGWVTVLTGALARTTRRAVDEDRASTAVTFAATVLGTGQAKFIAQNGKKRRIGIGVNREMLAIDLQDNVVRHEIPTALCIEPGTPHRTAAILTRSPALITRIE